MRPIVSKCRRVVFGAVICIALNACGGQSPGASIDGTGVPTYRGNSARTGEMVGPGPAGEQPRIAWEFTADGPFSNSPVVAAGTVFAASGEGRIHALDIVTGHERWVINLGVPVSATPLLATGLVIVADEEGGVHARKATDGTAVWTAAVEGGVTGSPATVGNDLIVATTEMRAYRLDAATGTPVWSTNVGGATTRSVTVDEDSAYLGLGNELVAIALVDGAQRWRTRIASTGNVGTPTVADGLVYAATGIGGEPEDYGIAAVEATTGTMRWAYASTERAVLYTPAVVDGRAFVLGKDRRVVAMDAVTGRELWSASFDHEFEALPSIVGDTIYVVGNGGPAAALDVTTGAQRWSVDIKGIPFAPAIADGYLLVGTDIGHLYAIGGGAG